MEEEGPLAEAEPPREHQVTQKLQAETKKPARRNKIKWPKSNEAEPWHTLDADLIKILEESLHGGVEAKLNLIGDTYT